MGRTPRRNRAETRAALFDALLRRAASPKKGGAERLLDATVALARRRGLIGERSELAAIDSTGLETRHVSAYFTKRCGRHNAHFKRRYPKLSAVCDTNTHLLLSAFVNRGPKPDHVEFVPTLLAAVKCQPIDTLLGDAGYESEPAHKFCREELGIESIFPTTPRGRPRRDGAAKAVNGKYRRQMLNDFPKTTYGQRWQIETTFSMLKRLLGSSLRNRRYHTINQEIILRAMTINLMII